MLYTSQMMRNLMLDLLDLACMENNTLKINNDYFCLQLVIEKAFIIVDHVANMKRIKLVKLISKDNEKNFALIFGDERRFIQILVNFLSNALKFSYKSSQIIVQLIVNDCRSINQNIKRATSKKIVSELNEPTTPKASVSIKEPTHFINFDLSVQDFGFGMSEESVGKLFIDFNKMQESENLNKNGVGLGLSICKNLIENMAGSVKVESKL